MTALNRVSRWAVVLSVGAVIGLAAVLLQFAVPLADDYCRGAVSDAFRQFQNNYFYWSGRWLSIGLGIEVLSKPSVLRHYPVVLGVMFFLAWAMWASVAAVLFQGLSSRRAVVTWGTVLFAVYWTGMPSPGESFYWVSGSFENLLGPILAAGCLACMAGYAGWKTRRSRAAILCAAALFGFASTGIHEVTALGLGLACTTITATMIWSRHPDRNAWIVLTLVIAVGALITIGAPGNFNRTRFFPESGSVLRSLQMTGWAAMTIVVPWILDIKVLTASALILLLPELNGTAPTWLSRSVLPWRWIIPGATLLLMVGIFLATGWGSGSMGPPRLHNQIYAMFLMGWMASLMAWRGRLAPAFQDSARQAPATAITAFALAASLMTAPNTINGLHDFLRAPSHNIVAWHDAIQQRYAQIASAAATGETDLDLSPLPMSPLSFGDLGLTTVKGNARNACTARYFKLNTVVVKKDGR
ncbi:MAG TPA: hypothetical protein DCG48_01155 [Rhodospirillaceae bacterium]|nr:hypothetical protein [Rhodospirillaceae bacterium]|tara:strand:+ start:1087 stop:2499 length:1413 start_codon:yes stop_codon:yes gene_type:complete